MKTSQKEKAERHFSRWASNYDSGKITEWFRYFQERTIEEIKPSQSEVILDVGCGTGWAVIQLGKMIPAGQICGVDLSSAMVNKAKANADGMKNVEFKVGDSENLPYDDKKFDSVMCTISFHHYPNPVGVLREFHRVLKPGGAAYVLDVIRDGSLLIFLYDIGQKVLFGDLVRYYRSNEIIDFFIKSDFKNVHENFRVKKLLLHKKFLTSVALISAKKE
jgi:ubiquinone/menaquinone biosynthesis C-methylase UbiE